MKIIFFAPYNISENIAIPLDSAPRIRCRKMYESLKSKCEVILVGGSAMERRLKINRLLKKNEIENVSGFYMESPNCSLKNFDINFLSLVKRNKIPMSMFYRDAHWKFSNFSKTYYQKLKYKRKYNKSNKQLQYFKIIFNYIYSSTREFAEFTGLNSEYLLPPGGEILEQRKDKKVGILFSGSPKKGFQNLIDANEILLSDGYKIPFFIVTKDFSFSIQDNVTVSKIVSEDIIRKVHIGIIPLEPTSYYRLALSLKFMQYLGFGLAVICQRFPAFEKYDDQYDVCHFFDGTSRDLAEKIRELIQNDSLRESISQNALDAVKNKENWGERARVILSDFKKIETT